MTDAELRDAAWKELAQTTVGYINKKWDVAPAGTHWANAKKLLDQIGSAPSPVPVPAPPPTNALFTQSYTAAEMQKLLTDGNLVRVAADRLAAVDDKTVKFTVKPGDVYSNWTGERSQVQLPQVQSGEGERFNWGFDFTLDAAWKDANTGNFWDAVLLFEFHHTGSTGSPPLSLLAYHGNLVTRMAPNGDPAQSNYWHETVICPLTPGVRMTLRVDALLSADLAKSKTVVTANGKAVVLGPGCNLLSGFKNYVEWGLYRHAESFDQTATFGPVSRFA